MLWQKDNVNIEGNMVVVDCYISMEKEIIVYILYLEWVGARL